jgi:hypothetical protein
MEVLKELAGDERSYRSLTRSWFEHSPLLQTLRKVAERVSPLSSLRIMVQYGSRMPARWWGTG